jgi:hypothetical protein
MALSNQKKQAINSKIGENSQNNFFQKSYKMKYKKFIKIEDFLGCVCFSFL